MATVLPPKSDRALTVGHAQRALTVEHPGGVATLKIKTGLTRMRFGLTSWRGGSLSYYLDGERVGAHDVTTYRALKIEIAPGEHVLEMRQEGLREGHVRTARVSFEVTAGESSQVIARARPARRLWVSSSNPIDDIKLVSHP